MIYFKLLLATTKNRGRVIVNDSRFGKFWLTEWRGRLFWNRRVETTRVTQSLRVWRRRKFARQERCITLAPCALADLRNSAFASLRKDTIMTPGRSTIPSKRIMV